MQPLNVTTLRQQIYTVFQKVVETNEPVIVKYNGEIIKISTMKDKNKLDNLIPHKDVLKIDPDKLVNLKVFEWKEKKNL